MFYVLWWLLNAALAAGWLVIGWHALKLLKHRFGTAIAFVFALASFSMMCGPSGEAESPKAAERKLVFAGGRSSASFTERSGLWTIEYSVSGGYNYSDRKTVEIYKNPLFKILLTVGYGQDTASGAPEPLFAYTSVEGTLGSTEWKPGPPVVFADESGKRMHYRVYGTMQWKLLNMDVSYQGKEFTGIIEL